MNLETASQVFQKGIRVTLGASAEVVEALQNPQKYGETLSRLQRGEFPQLAEEWAEKGAQTEQDARQFVENMMAGNSGSSSPSSASRPTDALVPLDIQTDLEDLKQQIISIRQDLES